jgi:FkbM family methyltransferase
MSRVDPVLYRMCLELVTPGACVWDVGANSGLFSFCASALAGRNGYVLAIEPDIWLAHLIHTSAQLWLQKKYPTAPVSVLCSAASDTQEIKPLQIAERARAANYLKEATGSSQSGGTRNQQFSVTVTLDSLLKFFRPPSVLKIDVETHETRVLSGAGELLRRGRPIVWCEVSPENYKPVFELLSSAGYDLFNAESKERLTGGSANWNTLAIPQ